MEDILSIRYFVWTHFFLWLGTFEAPLAKLSGLTMRKGSFHHILTASFLLHLTNWPIIENKSPSIIVFPPLPLEKHLFYIFWHDQTNNYSNLCYMDRRNVTQWAKNGKNSAIRNCCISVWGVIKLHLFGMCASLCSALLPKKRNFIAPFTLIQQLLIALFFPFLD